MPVVEAEWISRRETQTLYSVLHSSGFEAYAVGGCVRDSLLRMPVKDIDFSTNARPEDVISIAEKHGFRAVPTGINHGTVTVLIDSAVFEVTTFRKDIETDGRHAVVEFSNAIADDASRRDFTINALYAAKDGFVVDPLGGMPDLIARRIRFIDNAETRIREDHLRSLRFFRFHAWYANNEDGLDPNALDAIAGNIEGVLSLSRERVGSELLRLLAAKDPSLAVAGMDSVGLLHALLPGSDKRALAPLAFLESEFDVPPDPLRRLSSLGGVQISDRLRLSRNQANHLRILSEAILMNSKEAAFRFGSEIAFDSVLLQAATLGQQIHSDPRPELAVAARQTFPISASELMPRFEGNELGRALRKLERLWIESDFTLDRAELLKRVAEEG